MCDCLVLTVVNRGIDMDTRRYGGGSVVYSLAVRTGRDGREAKTMPNQTCHEPVVLVLSTLVHFIQFFVIDGHCGIEKDEM